MVIRSILSALAAASLVACASAPRAAAPAPATAPAATVRPFATYTTMQVPGGAYYEVTPAALAEGLRTKSFTLVNVHIPYAGELDKTDLAIPFDQIGAQIAKLPSNKSAPIFLYCRSGSMSATAAATLVKAGYTNVWDLAGGMNAWEQAGQPLIRKSPG